MNSLLITNKTKTNNNNKINFFENLPNNIESEKVILGCLIGNYEETANKIFCNLYDQDFYLREHQLIFKILNNLFIKSKSRFRNNQQ